MAAAFAMRRGGRRATVQDVGRGDPGVEREPLGPHSAGAEGRVVGASGGVSRRFDPIFKEYGRGLPVAYLRALAKRESNLNSAERKDPAWGLLQVIEVVRNDFNQRHGTGYSRQDLLDPKTNVMIAAELLRRVIESYRKNHPDVVNLQEDWSNPRFVELLTFGWNAGYSERGGVGRVARFLERQGRVDEVTINTIHTAAPAAGASRHLSNPRKVVWSKSVARLYERERSRERWPLQEA